MRNMLLLKPALVLVHQAIEQLVVKQQAICHKAQRWRVVRLDAREFLHEGRDALQHRIALSARVAVERRNLEGQNLVQVRALIRGIATAEGEVDEVVRSFGAQTLFGNELVALFVAAMLCKLVERRDDVLALCDGVEIRALDEVHNQALLGALSQTVANHTAHLLNQSRLLAVHLVVVVDQMQDVVQIDFLSCG